MSGGQEIHVPGVSVSGVALKRQISANMLFIWRRRYLHELAGASSAKLLLVSIEDAEFVVGAEMPEPIPAKQSARNKATASDCIEIEPLVCASG